MEHVKDHSADTNVGAVDRIAWQWRAHQFSRTYTPNHAPNRFGKQSPYGRYVRCRKAGVDFNVGSSEKPKLDKNVLTNGVMLDISELCRDVGKAQMHVIGTVLENNFELGVENDQQRYEFENRTMQQVKDLMKKQYNKPEAFFCELFELPHVNSFKHAMSPFARSLSLKDNFSSRVTCRQFEGPALRNGERMNNLTPHPFQPHGAQSFGGAELRTGETLSSSRPQRVQTEPASSTSRMDRTLLPEPSEPPFITTEPASPTNTMDGTLLIECLEPPLIETEPASPTMDGTLLPEPSEPPFVKTEPASATRIDGTVHQEPSKQPYIKTKPASPTRMEGTYSLPETSGPQPLSTTEELRYLYPLCWEIGLDLGVKPKCWTGNRQKLRSLLLTNGVMMEISRFTKGVCGNRLSEKQIVFDLLKHNFDLDVKKHELCDVFAEQYRIVSAKSRKLYSPITPSNKDLLTKFLDEPFSLLPIAKRIYKKMPHGTASESLKQVTEGRRLALKRKQEIDLEMEQKKEEQVRQRLVEIRRKELLRKEKQSKRLAIQETHAMKFDQEEELSSSYPYVGTGVGGQTTSWVKVETSSDDEEINMITATNEALNDEAWSCFFQLQSDTQATENLLEYPSKNLPDPIKRLHVMCNKLVRAVVGDAVEHEEMISRLAAIFWDGSASEVQLKQILTEYRSEILPLMVKEYGGLSDSEKTTLTQDDKLFCGLQLIDGLAHQARTTLLLWDKIVSGESEVAACNLEEAGLESGTVHLVRTVSDAAQRRGFTENGELVTFENFLIDRGEFDDMPLTSPRGGRIDRLFQDGALVYSILDDMREFTRDHVDEDGHLKAVAANVDVPHLRAGIRALGLISKLVIDPLLKAITFRGSGTMLEMEGRYETLVTKLEKWQQDSRDLIEGRTCLYDDIEVPKDLVFDRLTTWTDTDFHELTVQILELLLATFEVVCRRMQVEDEKLKQVMTGSLSKGLGGVEQLHKAKMNAVTIAVESMITLKSKRSWEWLSSLDKQRFI